MNRPFNLVELIRILLKWKLPIIIFIAVAAIGSVVVSLVMDEYYQSQSVFYPTNLTVTDRQMLFSETTGDRPPSYFGDKRDVERVLTIARSAPLVDFMINHFKLHEVYDIDTTQRHWRFKTKREFKSNFSAIKTELGAIELTILDTNPQRAAEMVNTMVEVIDKENSQMVSNMKGGIVSSFEQKVKDMRKRVQQLTDTMSTLKEQYNIREVSANEDGQTFYKAEDPSAIERFKVLQSRHENALKELNKFSSLYEQYELSANQEISSLYILQQAYPSNKKSKPIRWLICVSTTLIATFLALIGAVMAEKLKDLREALKNDTDAY